MALFPKKGYGFYVSCLLDGGKSNGVVLQEFTWYFIHAVTFDWASLINVYM